MFSGKKKEGRMGESLVLVFDVNKSFVFSPPLSYTV